jgi:hypothetical protein
MLSTYNLNKPIKDHYFILLALCISLLLPTVTHARECGDIESKEFWQNATAEEVNECVIDRLAPPLETTIATFGGLGSGQSTPRPITGEVGNGLGLNIVERVMEEHGGEFVWPKNRAGQQGTEVSIKFSINSEFESP